MERGSSLTTSFFYFPGFFFVRLNSPFNWTFQDFFVRLFSPIKRTIFSSQNFFVRLSYEKPFDLGGRARYNGVSSNQEDFSMCIITNLTKLVEELTAQRMMPVENSADSPSEATENRGPYDEGFVPVEAEEGDDLFDEGFVEMMPCDFSGYCVGSSCPNYFTVCHPELK